MYTVSINNIKQNGEYGSFDGAYTAGFRWAEARRENGEDYVKLMIINEETGIARLFEFGRTIETTNGEKIMNTYLAPNEAILKAIIEKAPGPQTFEGIAEIQELGWMTLIHNPEDDTYIADITELGDFIYREITGL